jgi:hypothetical protein
MIVNVDRFMQWESEVGRAIYIQIEYIGMNADTDSRTNEVVYKYYIYAKQKVLDLIIRKMFGIVGIKNFQIVPEFMGRFIK